MVNAPLHQSTLTYDLTVCTSTVYLYQSGEGVALTESFGYSRLQEEVPHTISGGKGGGEGEGGGERERERASYDADTHMEGDTTYNTEEGGMACHSLFHLDLHSTYFMHS